MAPEVLFLKPMPPLISAFSDYPCIYEGLGGWVFPKLATYAQRRAAWRELLASLMEPIPCAMPAEARTGTNENYNPSKPRAEEFP